MSFEVNPLKSGLMNSAQDTYAGNGCHGCFFYGISLFLISTQFMCRAEH